jgi:hypothetical protein
MIDPKNIMKAIVDLREHLKMSQTTFAINVLGKTLPTQQRYERVVPPPAPELAALVAVARQAGRIDLAEVFKQAAIETVPPELRELIKEGDREGRSEPKAAPKGASNQQKAGRA